MERYLSRMPQAGWLDALGARAAILLGCEGWFFLWWGVSLPSMAAGLALTALICLALRLWKKRSVARREQALRERIGGEMALETLLRGAGAEASGPACLCLGGALGEHVRHDSLERLGFLPAGLGARVRAVGNSSLDGAALLAVDEQARAALRRLCDGARLLSLTDDPGFHDAYMRHMRFVWR